MAFDVTSSTEPRTVKINAKEQQGAVQRTPYLFGLPYGFPSTVDMRVKAVNSSLGKTYVENIITQAPVLTVIPGKPLYLSKLSKNDKTSFTVGLLSAAEGFSSILDTMGNMQLKDLKLYEFQSDYSNYIAAVNVMCRAGAVFLEIDDKMQVGGHNYSFQSFNWRHYQFRTNNNVLKQPKKASAQVASVKNGGGLSNVSTIFNPFTPTDDANSTIAEVANVINFQNYVQFYVNPEGAVSEDLSNSPQDSMISDMFNKAEGIVKDIAFMVQAGTGSNVGWEKYNKFIDKSTASFSAATNELLGGGDSIFGMMGGMLSRLTNLGGDVLKGNNIVIPKIYNSSEYSKSYSINIELRNPYGNKLGYYMNIYVPMCHALGLVLPQQADANAYSSPFLVKAFLPGVFSCNLGLVTSFSIQRKLETFTVDGLPNEVDINMSIQDLYSDLSYTTGNDPLLLVNNPSLIEFMSVNCGMNIIEPNISAKFNLMVSTVKNAFGDIPAGVGSKVHEKIWEPLNKFLSFYRT